MRESKLGRRASIVHGPAKLANCLDETNEDRSSDYRMADIQLLDLGNRGDRADVLNRQPVTSVHR
jgi:hypothetical protein